MFIKPSRRDLLKLLPAVALVPKLRGARVKITDVRLVQLKVMKDLGSYPDWVGNPRRIRIGGGAFTEIATDQGVTGIGPEFGPELLPAIKSALVGTDPFDMDIHAEKLSEIPSSSNTGAASAEIALCDLVGKLTGQPLYKLWDGGRERVAPYASMLRLSTPEERADISVKLKSQGWQAIKFRSSFPSKKIFGWWKP